MKTGVYQALTAELPKSLVGALRRAQNGGEHTLARASGVGRNMSSRNLRLYSLTILLALLAGCTGSTPGPGPGPGPTPGTVTAPALVNLQDAAPDRVLALKLKISDITAHQTTGASISILNAASGITVETVYRQGLLQPVNLSLTSVTPGTYDSIDVTFSAAGSAVTFVNAGIQTDSTPTFTTTSASAALFPNFTVSSNPAVVVNLTFQPSSVAINTSTNEVTISPTLTATMALSATPSTQTETTGLIQGFTGVVVATPAPGASTFQISSSQLANPITIGTDSSTTFSGDLGSFGALDAGNIVQVTTEMNPSGTLLARTIDGENAGVGLGSGGDFRGPLTAVNHTLVTPFDATDFTMMVQNVSAAAGAVTPGTSQSVTFVLPLPAYQVDQQAVDLTTVIRRPDTSVFPPTFDSPHLQPGQEISLIYSATPSAPKKLKLRLQSFNGTVGAIATGSPGQTLFPLTLPADHWFVLLTGKTTITVVRQPSSTGPAAVSGTPIRARGLLFWDDVTDTYYLIVDQFAP